MRLLFIIFALISLFSFACQNSADKILADDVQSKTVIKQVNGEINATRSISPENFEKLKAVFENYPKTREVRETYKNALIVRDDLDSLEKFFTANDSPDLSNNDRKNLARLYIKNGKDQKALEVLDVLLKANPNDTEVRGMNGLALFNLGKLDEAGKEFDSVWDKIINGKMVEEITTRGIIYYRQNDLPKAIETLKKALKINPEHISSNYTLSRIYAEQGDPEQAEVYRKKTDEFQNKEKAATFEKGKAVKMSVDLQNAWKEKRYQEVIDLANQMLPTTEDKNQKTILYQFIFESYKALGKLVEAEKARQTAQDLNTK